MEILGNRSNIELFGRWNYKKPKNLADNISQDIIELYM